MTSLRKPSEEGRASSSPKSVITSGLLTSMDLKAPTYLRDTAVFSTTRRDSLDSVSSFFSSNRDNPFADAFPDPLCKLNLKETSEFVKAFPMATKCSSRNMGLSENSAQRRREGLGSVGKRGVEAPATPGRPFFNFSPGHPSRKSIPSKWDDAEKWLISSSCHESPAHVTKPGDKSKISRQNDVLQQKGDLSAEKQASVADEKPPCSTISNRNGPVMCMLPNVAFSGASSEVLLKDKFTDNVEPLHPNFRYLEPSTEGFLFKSSYCKPMKDATQTTAAAAAELDRRDVGTETTPLGSSTTTRCHTPFKNSSPARHNTPADRSGLLVPSKTSIDISELKDCHFAKLELSAQYDSFVSNWSSREEEEEEVSKSLRHLEITSGRKSITESRTSIWEEEERTKSCIRYQREEAKIQAWVNLQSAKAEAQSRKLEVKIQKMRSNLEEKLMKRMSIVHRRAEEWRSAAQLQHSQQMQRAIEHAQKLKTQQSPHLSGQTVCGCFPCNNHHL